MPGPNKEIGIFDAIYSLMEHEHRLQGAELSGQRIRALQAGNTDIFNQTTEQIGQVDAKLLFILQKREAQAAEFREKGIEQPGLSMAEKLHEYMLILSGGSQQRLATTPIREDVVNPTTTSPGVIRPTSVPAESSNGRVPDEFPLPRTEVITSPLTTELSTHIEQPLESPIEPPIEPPQSPEPIDPLVEFKALIPEDLNWDIPSRPLTQKLESGRLPFGIRPARVTLSSVKYGANLERLNDRRPRAVQEAYADGPDYAPIPKAAVESAITNFITDYMLRKGKRLADLPQEVQDTISRIKEDPILGPLTRNSKGRQRLLDYALYNQSLPQTLIESKSDTPGEDETEPQGTSLKKERTPRAERAKEPKVAELAPQQLKTVETYLRIYVERGWPSDMRRAVALDQYRDQIPGASTVSDFEREEVISNKMGAVARERARAEKKIVEAVALIEQGAKPSTTIQEIIKDTERMLGVNKVTLSEVLDLLNKRVTPDELRKRNAPRAQSDFSEQRDSVKRWSQILP